MSKFVPTTTDGLVDVVDNDRIDYVEEPNCPPITTTTTATAGNPLSDETSEEASSSRRHSVVSSHPSSEASSSRPSIASAYDLAMKKASYKNNPEVGGGGRISRISRALANKPGVTSTDSPATRLSRQGSVTRQQRQPQLPNRVDGNYEENVGKDDADDDDDTPGALRVYGLEGNRGGTSMDNLFVSMSSLQQQPQQQQLQQEQDETAAVTTVEARLARDEADVINEARREWERGIITAEVVTAVGAAATTREELLEGQQEQSIPIDSQQQQLQSSKQDGDGQDLTFRSRRSSKIAIVSVIIVIVVVVVTTIIVRKGGSSGNDKYDDDYSDSPWLRSRRKDFVQVLSLISNENEFSSVDKTAPQSRALEFLVRHDKARIDPRVMPVDELIQRYILIVLHFATIGGGDGDGGSNLLKQMPGQGSNPWSRSHSNVCEWDGVTCEEYSQVVIALNLSKFSDCLLLSSGIFMNTKPL